ncbi:chromosome segregation protein [Sporocytophaga myxococcoides]|uniref:Chromosome partition protein Smc n=1 Tax=Sporocytophaga myxococcoides TaxID=153721 RepID=A0A098L915_9BACT|nr:chromosome segregation protein SMC [Sporocytophaga myxococcoides]GAL83077.1 chromosome segregation protein [Sporocytophaga myxococcoides]
MQLSKLEIKGFKSFGDKVTINFDEGITGIVGPNGCGKSNVVDAIRWVLGEQKTKALRSEKMENVIFNGTKTRKPLQMAEVSLTFNNTKNLLPTEYSHVTITRRYYRSGESEYLLNGVTCRLKDITNLFLDTGIGSDSYAIIELKMVDDILNDKDNSRRTLFEEAAGISKFKVRKKQSLKKLEDTDKDLERVDDLLFEINKNLKSLEKQAKQTEKYFQVKEQYKQVSIDLAKVTIQGQREDFLSLQKQLEEETDKRIGYNTQIAEKEGGVEKEKAELVNREKTLASRQKTLNEHVNKIRNYESDKKIKHERLSFLNDKNNNLREQIEQDKKSNERAEFSISSLQAEAETAEKIMAEIEVKVQAYKEDYETQKASTSRLQEELSVLSGQLRKKQEEVFHLNKNIEIFQIQASSLKQELEKTTSDSSAHSASLADFESKVQEISEELQSKNLKLEKLENQESTLQEEITQLEKEIETIKDQITQINRKLDSKQNEYSLTKSLVDNLEGFPEAIKFLKKNSHWGKEAPLLSDILTCEDQYRVSIENYLEPFMNYYVVENEAQAVQAVNLLSDSAKGRANFFVLSTFENFNAAPVKAYDHCKAAKDIIEFDPKYKNLVAFILDNVYIITNNQEELPQDNDAIFITQNGKLTKRKFSISGGSVGLFEGKRIGRAKNLEKLQQEIKALSSELDELKLNLEKKQRELFKFKESTLKASIEELKKEINLTSQNYISVKTKLEQFTEMINSNALKRDDIIDKIEKLEDDIQDAKPRAEEAKSILSDLESRLQELNEDLMIQNEQLTNKSSIFNQENIVFHQQKNKISSLLQEIEYKQAAYDSSKQRIEKNLEDAQKTEEEINILLERADVSDDELVEFYKEKEAIEQGVNEAEKEYYGARAFIDELEKESRDLRRLRDNCDALLLEIQTKLNDNKLSLSSIKERLSVEFNIDIDELLSQDSNVEASEEELKQKVIQIKNSLDKMGPINPMAMEAYQEIQERHKFISEQKDDLTKAKDSLLQTINEIDSVAKDTFMEAYDKIRENFVRVFRSLFSEEDSCDLKLEHPDNPLESSIDIIAKPKGKRPLTINQLSGGEKTLTAISLLFAIYLIKPAPFCIFDEVDAPLDDANIDKFNNIIRKFSQESQFIIVTHNKRTMSSTDIIYGITMVEQGVSRLVPVDLRSLA